MESFLLKVRLLTRAELVVGRLHIRRAARQACLIAVGVVAILLAIAMTNVAAYFYLADHLGRGAAALVLAGVNALLAVILFLVSNRLGLGPEEQMANEIRDLAVAQISADAQRVIDDVDRIRSDVEQIRTVISSLKGGDLFSLAALGPLVKLLTGASRTRQGQS